MLAPSPFAVLDHSLMTMTMTSADDEERGPSPVQRLLTDRQELIALMVIRGETCVSITGRLQVPICAIEGHAYRILEMLGLSTLGELTEESIERYRVGFDVRDGTPDGGGDCAEHEGVEDDGVQIGVVRSAVQRARRPLVSHTPGRTPAVHGLSPRCVRQQVDAPWTPRPGAGQVTDDARRREYEWMRKAALPPAGWSLWSRCSPW